MSGPLSPVPVEVTTNLKTGLLDAQPGAASTKADQARKERSSVIME